MSCYTFGFFRFVSCFTAGVPQGAIWSPLFNLCIHQLPTVVKNSLLVGYADDHSFLKIIAGKTDHIADMSDLNCNLTALLYIILAKVDKLNLLLTKHPP